MAKARGPRRNKLMGFLTSAKTFDSVFEDAPQQTPAKEFLQEVAAYLKKKSTVPWAKDLGLWIESGKELSAFVCREDVMFDMAEELYEANVPYMVTTTVNGKIGFLVKQTDEEAAMAAKSRMLSRKGRSCMVVSSKEMLHQIGQSRETDKSCLAIHGLTRGQVQIIQDKYAEYMDVPKIGVDRMQDGTYTVSMFAKNSIKKNARAGVDFCRIFLETMMATSGPNAIKNNAYAALEADFKSWLAADFKEKGVNRNKTPLWIVGASKQFMKITEKDFIYGHAVMKNGTITLETEVQALADQPDYREFLVSYAFRIPYKSLTYDQTKVMRHLSKANDTDEEDTLDNSPMSNYRVWARGEKKLAKAIDIMMTRKLQNDEIMVMDGRYNEKFHHYVQEAIHFFEALGLDRMPPGYDVEDIDVVKSIMEKHRMDGEMYEHTAQAMQAVEAIILTNTIERISDVNERIGIKREEIERNKELEREERAARSKARAKSASKGRE